MRRFLMLSSGLAAVVAAVSWAGTTATPFVSDQGAYGFYMPPNHGMRTMRCRVNYLWGAAEQSFAVKEGWLACSAVAYYNASGRKDPAIPIQWDPSHVRMYPQKPD